MASEARAFQASGAAEPEPESDAEREDMAGIQRLLEQVQQAIVSMASIAKQMDQEMENAVGLLSLGLAEIMVNHTVTSTPEVVLNNLARALRKGQGQDVRNVRLNPADMGPVRASKEKLSDIVENFKDLRLEADATIGRGGCVVETGFGTIDATYENQFMVLLNAFKAMTGVK